MKVRDGATIKIHPNTRDRLKSFKRGGETYDEAINRLLNILKLDDKEKDQ